MGRRQVKEFRPDEALSLISADREGKTLHCPCCGSDTIGRTPDRQSAAARQPGRVQLCCDGCGRLVSYTDLPESARASRH